jgi:hypothetical protein
VGGSRHGRVADRRHELRARHPGHEGYVVVVVKIGASERYRELGLDDLDESRSRAREAIEVGDESGQERH